MVRSRSRDFAVATLYARRRLGERRRQPACRKPGASKEGAVMARTAALPALKAESGLSHYLDEIRRFPMLETQEEYMLASSWREDGDREEAHKLVTNPFGLVDKFDLSNTG